MEAKRRKSKGKWSNNPTLLHVLPPWPATLASFYPHYTYSFFVLPPLPPTLGSFYPLLPFYPCVSLAPPPPLTLCYLHSRSVKVLKPQPLYPEPVRFNPQTRSLPNTSHLMHLIWPFYPLTLTPFYPSNLIPLCCGVFFGCPVKNPPLLHITDLSSSLITPVS